MTILLPDNPIPRQFELAMQMVAAVGRREFVCAALAGGPGIGKTFLTERTLNSMGVPYQIVRGTSHAALLLAAYQMRDGGVIFLDDADSLVLGGGTHGANTMKQLTAPLKVRTIHNHTISAFKNMHAKKRNPFIPPPEFQTKVGFLWNTNMVFDGDSVDPAKMEHIQPLIDRGLQPIRISDDPTHLLNYVMHLVADQNLRLGGHRILSLVERQEVVDYYHDNAWRLNPISVRMLETFGQYRSSFPTNWKEQAEGRLHRESIYDLPKGPKPIVSVPTLKKAA
jgi:hypothetical protein